ncbi:MAG: hypothetical protein EB059_08335, partial [Alphaproteobacteria bacterium]|nr:hypothetical protein [Alphaproteobacteria bacterium]
AKALSAAGKKYKAMEWLRHRVAKRGILANNSVGHRLFAELCIEDNRLAEARESLDGLPPWYRDSGAYFTMARVEICSHRIGKAMGFLVDAAHLARDAGELIPCFALMTLADEKHNAVAMASRVLTEQEKMRAATLVECWRSDPRKIAYPIGLNIKYE